jgi:RNA polymerase sigma factor (sigma-70 family)
MSVEMPETAREVAETLLLDPEERAKLLGMAERRYGLSRDVAEDLLQETAVELLGQRQYVQKPRGYLYAVFRFRCWRYLKLQRVNPELTVEELPEQASPPPEIVQQVILWQALGSVSPGCRKLLAARYLEGQSLREAALSMMLAYSGITKTISRCLQKLRACLT